ncbi:vitamin K epoxide reductase complex subunit 1 [Maniola jurtina]|uniref:vitamin K epoxide reductase complex subunit 1 n=1 Tax=Maniola jurtina TaxID=191418 RepID=UPI001E686910|nr:vitamin K epoxide reductase complex subunit 1 [Maniola jurtina]XP_045772924.1 vitamin K epoxide reductase complex subunit 1 [Maniola jurtina]XP_045772925.1 vitamin K epoxide reductase complex subunit 1 [Maniola jurtina]XP_045772926.1 vitamin K epoxide reductase complex subunit 1 [Maniola jurtina]XP_045772928.1 vitamin K epoxide reductase complex subunit 1 [Maniola jurtina]XP_045772929.1 vitamin K epoxide reductase complex subunit 1 [Maniola jurtina]XP_045772930.1 vitamin K epoxide reductas
MKAKQLNRAIITISLIGVLLSTYALYVELLAELRPGYKALCDISEHASCSRVLTSKYGKGLGLVPEDSPFKVPNCVYGIIFYCIIILLTTFDQVYMVRLQLGISAVSLLTCVYLAYLLIFVLKDFCLVCVTTYVLNIANTLLLKKKHSLLALKNK